MKTILAFLAALPELIKLINNLQKRMERAEHKTKVKEDVKKINKAFEDNDEEALNRIFSNTD